MNNSNFSIWQANKHKQTNANGTVNHNIYFPCPGADEMPVTKLLMKYTFVLIGNFPQKTNLNEEMMTKNFHGENNPVPK